MKSNYIKEQIIIKCSNINVAALSSSAQHYRTIMSTSLRHFQSRKLTALNLIYAETIHNCTELVLKRRWHTCTCNHREIYRNSLLYVTYPHIYTLPCAHTFTYTIYTTGNYWSLTKDNHTFSGSNLALYPYNDYFVTPSRSVNSRGSLEIRS